jgi:MFS family permease
MVAGDLPLFGLMLLAFVVTLCFAVMEATLALFAQARFGWGDFQISWVFVFIGVLVVVIQGGLIGWLVRRFGERRLVPAGIAFMAAGLLVMAAAGVPAMLLAAAALLALGAGLHNPTYVGLLSRLADEESQGGVLGLSRSFSSLARVLGPLAGTWVFQHLGAEAPFVQSGALMVVAFLAALWIVRRAAAAAARRDTETAAATPAPTPGT